jgi:hypothetical protein
MVRTDKHTKGIYDTTFPRSRVPESNQPKPDFPSLQGSGLLHQLNRIDQKFGPVVEIVHFTVQLSPLQDDQTAGGGKAWEKCRIGQKSFKIGFISCC